MEVISHFNGKVFAVVGWENDLGLSVSIIEHGNGKMHTFGHLAFTTLRAGDEIEEGDVIGVV